MCTPVSGVVVCVAPVAGAVGCAGARVRARRRPMRRPGGGAACAARAVAKRDS